MFDSGNGAACPSHSADALTIRRWTAADWAGAEAPWTGLLERSQCDPLFLSWEWLSSWWHWFGRAAGYELCIQAAYRGGSLVGIAPLYASTRRRGPLFARSLQFIGLSSGDSGALISEYLDVIAHPDERAAVREACLASLLQPDGSRWSNLEIGYTLAATEWQAAFSKVALPAVHYTRIVDRSISYQADLSAGFAAYLQSLGGSTRRSLWNLRRRLVKAGAVRLELIQADQVRAAFRDLNRLHLTRWGSPAFSGRRLRFHEMIATRLAGRGELALSRLWVGQRVVSVLYDIRKGSRQYNLKLGFDADFAPHYSLGLLHLGYGMEAASDAGIQVYDLLAGCGRRSDFKSHLARGRLELHTVQMLRGRLLPRLYRFYDRRRKRNPTAA